MNEHSTSKIEQECDKQDIYGDIEDGYIKRKIDMFFSLTGRFDPAIEKKVATALDDVINCTYEEGFIDGVDNEQRTHKKENEMELQK